ncbi:plasminogen [Patella vulgata]|uniref:plasminogen n=1 Tax=Patella vulgata TaxID=6465 RepID=UPI0021808ACF|nr:plasminogen [Patella vulgata]
MVSLKTAGQHFCGGVLISREWVVSAAHCMLFMPGMDDPNLWEIRLGRFDPAFNVTEPETEQTFNISGKPIFYDGLDVEQFYRGLPVDNDLVLLKLARPAIITSWVKPICLPEKDEEPVNRERCVITGYGQTIPNVGPPRKLKQAIIPIVDFETCQDIEGYKKLLTSNMICAGYKDGGVDSCKMDSGGPLQCFGNERWVVSGITSWGDAGQSGCAKALRPGVYTKVSSYSSWIKNMIYEDYVATRNKQ